MSWDRMQIQPAHVARALWGGVAASIVITCLMYLVPFTGATVWNVPSMIAKVLSFDEPMIFGNGMWILGFLVYATLGVFALPVCYADWVYGYLPGPAWLRGVIYAVLLWVFVQLSVLPLIGQGAFDRKGPNPAAEVLSQLVLWLIYGFILGLIAGPQQVWRHRPHQETAA